jgi:DNA-binding NtrC family response regulator
MQALKQSIVTAAGCSSTVLITGESGTGKELIARARFMSLARTEVTRSSLLIAAP